MSYAESSTDSVGSHHGWEEPPIVDVPLATVTYTRAAVVVSYTIRCRTAAAQWEVSKTYSDCRNLHRELLATLCPWARRAAARTVARAADPAARSLPAFPGSRRPLPGSRTNTSRARIDVRRQRLAAWLSELVSPLQLHYRRLGRVIDDFLGRDEPGRSFGPKPPERQWLKQRQPPPRINVTHWRGSLNEWQPPPGSLPPAGGSPSARPADTRSGPAVVIVLPACRLRHEALGAVFEIASEWGESRNRLRRRAQQLTRFYQQVMHGGGDTLPASSSDVVRALLQMRKDDEAAQQQDDSPRQQQQQQQQPCGIAAFSGLAAPILRGLRRSPTPPRRRRALSPALSLRRGPPDNAEHCVLGWGGRPELPAGCRCTRGFFCNAPGRTNLYRVPACGWTVVVTPPDE